MIGAFPSVEQLNDARFLAAGPYLSHVPQETRDDYEFELTNRPLGGIARDLAAAHAALHEMVLRVNAAEKKALDLERANQSIHDTAAREIREAREKTEQFRAWSERGRTWERLIRALVPGRGPELLDQQAVCDELKRAIDEANGARIERAQNRRGK